VTRPQETGDRSRLLHLLSFLRRHRRAAVFAAIFLPLAAGALTFDTLAAGRRLTASELVREARAERVLAAVEEIRSGAVAPLRTLIETPVGRTAAGVRGVLAAAGWEPVPGIVTPGDSLTGVSRAFLDAVEREGVVAAFDFTPDDPHLLVGVRTDPAGALRTGPGTAPLVIASRPASGLIARALGSEPGLGAALYVAGRRLITAAGPLGTLLPEEMDSDLVMTVIGEERPLPVATGSGDAFLGALVPLKDFEAWDVIGLVLAGAPRSNWSGLGYGGGRGPDRAGAPAPELMIAPPRPLSLVLLLLALLAAATVAGAAGFEPGWGRAAIALGLIPVLGGGVAMRAHLHAGIRAVLAGGPEPVLDSLAAGGLVERYSFGLELALIGAFVGLVFWTALVLLTTWNLERPRTLRTTFTAYAFLSPAVIGLVIFFLGPMLFALYISFHSWSIVEPTKPFVGLANYADLVANADFRHALGITFIYTLHVPVSMALALGLALLLNRPLRGVGIFRTLFFLPSITSFVAIAMVWEWIYNPDFGLANVALGLFGFDGSGWLTDPATALPSLMLMAIWIGMGYQMVIFLAGLQGIPHTLYEAAVIDGAGPVRRFMRITLPLLKPTIFFVLVTSLIGSFQVFTQVYIMTDGGPVRATDVVVYHIYSAAWDQFRMGSAAAMSWVLFVIIMLLTLLQFRLAGRETSYV